MYGAIHATEQLKGSTANEDRAASSEVMHQQNEVSTTSILRKRIGAFFILCFAAVYGFVSKPFKVGSSGLPLSRSLPLPLFGATNSDSTISKRAQALQPTRNDLEVFFTSASDPYDPIENPEGYLVMLVAENKLMWKEMAKKIEEVQASEPLPEWIFNYGDFGGDQKFKESMRNMMQNWIKAPIDTKYLRFQAGAGSVLSQLSYILADSGDGVLHTGPGYPAFVGDFGVYGHTTIHVAETKEKNNFEPTKEDLNEVYDRSVAAGNPPKILIICQPNNPTGVIYSGKSMKMMIEWAIERDMHVVSDEIYALSTFPGFETISAADIMREKNPNVTSYLGNQVHIVAGLSKDWGMSGFRVGSLLSQNEKLLRVFDTVDYYQGVSSYTQFILTAVFRDDDFVRWYIGENQRRLHETYMELKKALSIIDVPLFEPQGAIFAWADFSAYLKDGQTEEELWLELFHDARVVFTTGESCYADKPGLFRVVYPWPEGGPQAMKELGRRLERWAENR